MKGFVVTLNLMPDHLTPDFEIRGLCSNLVMIITAMDKVPEREQPPNHKYLRADLGKLLEMVELSETLPRTGAWADRLSEN